MIDEAVLGSECSYKKHVFADGVPFAMRRTDIGGDNMLHRKGDQLAIQHGKNCAGRNGHRGKQALAVDSTLADSCVGNVADALYFVIHAITFEIRYLRGFTSQYENHHGHHHDEHEPGTPPSPLAPAKMM